MSSAWMPRKRVILAIHRWIGAAAALFLVVLSLTGLAINHTERLGLDGIHLDAPWLLSRYGMQPEGDAAPIAYAAGETLRVVHFRDQLFIGGKPVVDAPRPIGLVSGNLITVVVTPRKLIYLGKDGSLVEEVAVESLPFDAITAVGHTSDGRTVLVTPDGNWTPDEDWIDFRPCHDPFTVKPLDPIPLEPDEAARLAATYRGDGVSLYRVLLDLHSGRLFGWEGRTLMDLTAVAVLLLVASGTIGWMRKSRSNGAAQ